MNRSRSRMVGVLAGLLLALAMAGAASAYWRQTPATVTISGPRGTIECGDRVTFTATVRDATGTPIARSGPVRWSFQTSPSNKDQIAPKQSNTKADGVATTRIKFACVPGTRVLRATADNVSGSITITVSTDDDRVQGEVRGSSRSAPIELPRTSTAPDEPSGGLLLALLALLTGSGLILRRWASPRR